MKFPLLLIFTLFISFFVKSQNSNEWIAFTNESQTLIGFKDSEGNIKIPPKYSTYIPAKSFEHIIIVSEEESKPYYLTKSGLKVGIDSLFHIDPYDECEQEGFIRFRNPKTNKVGLLNRFGKVAIPAEYDILDKVTNGYIWAYNEDVKSKDHLSNSLTSNTHGNWSQGQNMLLDTNGNILINQFDIKGFINMYSMIISKNKKDNSQFQTFKGENGMYYSFIDLQIEFENWLNQTFLKTLTPEHINSLSYPNIKSSYTSQHATVQSKNVFIKKNFSKLKHFLNTIKNRTSEVSIGLDRMFLSHYEQILPNAYFTNCDEIQFDKYPIWNVLITQELPSGTKQTNLYFIKTIKGYQFIGIEW